MAPLKNNPYVPLANAVVKACHQAGEGGFDKARLSVILIECITAEFERFHDFSPVFFRGYVLRNLFLKDRLPL